MVEDVLKLAKESDAQMVDYRFIDMPGMWQHFSAHIGTLDEDTFEEGVGFDGSSIRGFQSIDQSDMILIPDPTTAFIDPFMKIPTLVLICDIKDPVTLELYDRDPRHVAIKAEQYMKSTGIGDVAYFGPEAEFFVFDDVRYSGSENHAFYEVDSSEGAWNTGANEDPNLGHKNRYKEGYFPVPPNDTLQDVRSEMMLTMLECDVDCEDHDNVVASAGQSEIEIRFDTLVTTADKLMKYKYIVKNVARKHGKTATFMPKPVFLDNGTGMHCHQSIWKDGVNIMYRAGTYGDLSPDALYYIGGLLKHAPALLAFTNPTTNSYRRLVPGYEAPINLIYSCRNRSACVRIPMYSSSEKAKRVEFRCPDPSCNPYLAFAAMLMAGLDGIQNKIMPPEPIDKNLYDLEPEEKGSVQQTPGSLPEALDALEADYEFLLKGDVFTKDVIENWIENKPEEEVDPDRLL
ncbi:MAG: type I glutamate--ammonia ligase, partial [Gammaproteobacteria bacterium]|nr:type I glutamate--ammonia ligase [Gammaproteobacteria bacterium]